MIIAVTGPPGAGKTHWIREHISKTPQPARYFNPGEGSVVIDATCLVSEFSEVKILTPGEEFELFNPDPQLTTYIEIPWHLDLSSVDPLLEQLNAESVVIENHKIAEHLTPIQTSEVQIHRSLLSGEILDWSSLAVFWFELIKGAYGEVIRAKGIFDIISGESIYGDFVAGRMNQEFVALNVPLWLAGRPERFSGLEIVGFNLNKAELSQTLKDCFIPESQISYYQQQIQTSLETEEEIKV